MVVPSRSTKLVPVRIVRQVAVAAEDVSTDRAVTSAMTAAGAVVVAGEDVEAADAISVVANRQVKIFLDKRPGFRPRAFFCVWACGGELGARTGGEGTAERQSSFTRQTLLNHGWLGFPQI